MWNTKKIVLLSCGIVLLACSCVLVIKLRDRSRSGQDGDVRTENAKRVIDPFGKASRPAKHLDRDQIDKFWATSIGREYVCDAVGENPRTGLDNDSYAAILKVLALQDQTDDVCLKAVVERLYYQLRLEEPPPWKNLHVNASHDLEIRVLRKNSTAVAVIIKQEYALGTADPQVMSIPLLLAVKDRASCTDIDQTKTLLRVAHNAFADDFEYAYKTICK